MTNKRFWWNCKHIEVDNNLGVAFCTKNNDFCNKSKCTEIQGNPKKQYYRERMEELQKENEMLKEELNALHEENMKIKSLLLKKIEQLNNDYERSAKAGMPTGGIIGELDSFEEICEKMGWKND